MNYQKFLEEVYSGLQRSFGDDYCITIQESLKINGKKAVGISIQVKKGKEQVTPILYGERMYQEYQEHHDLELCIRQMKQQYLACKDYAFELLHDIYDWERIKGCLYPIIISKDKNENLLETLVHRPYLDLAICYILRNSQKQEEEFTAIKIKPSILGIWGCTEKELYKKAIENLKEDGYQIQDMITVIQDIAGEVVLNDSEEEGVLYVMTNELKYYGASGILNQEMLRRFAEKLNKNFYIIPSSTHETILVPDNGSQMTGDLNKMICEINEEQVEIEERLADHAYYYNRVKQEIQIAV